MHRWLTNQLSWPCLGLGPSPLGTSSYNVSLPAASASGTEGSLLIIEKYTSLKVEGAWEPSGSTSVLQMGRGPERGKDLIKIGQDISQWWR